MGLASEGLMKKRLFKILWVTASVVMLSLPSILFVVLIAVGLKYLGVF